MFSPNTPVSSINKTDNQDIYTLYAYCVGATVWIVSSQLCKPDHYETVSSNDVVYKTVEIWCKQLY
jgi:hypothetical protein